MPDIVIETMREKGFDLSMKKRKEITKEMLAGVDSVVAMVEVPMPEWLMESPKLTRWDVLDAKGKDLDFHRMVRDRIYQLVQNLISE